MTTQTPMTTEAVFDGLPFRTNLGREGTRHYFNGHLTPDQIAHTYYELYPDHRTDHPHTIDTNSIEHAWHQFTAHEDTCALITDEDPDDPWTDEDYLDPTFCTCNAGPGLDDGKGYEYREPHPASAGQPGAVAVTWVNIHLAA
ncbi:hypothetical protein ACFWCM_12820 [Streptomyces albidoflavus]